MKSTRMAALPIAALPEGEMCPPLEPDHPTWDIIAPWDDPLASRGGYNVNSCKVRETFQGCAAIRLGAYTLDYRSEDRMFVVGAPEWREYSLACRVQALQDAAGATHDEPFNTHARCGLVFRIDTVRKYYGFCIRDRKRLVLYRRDDAEYTELAGCAADPGERVITLRVSLDGDGIHADCPELEIALDATDCRFRSGRAGFRAIGTCRLFALDVTMTPGQEAVNARRAADATQRTASLSATLPDEIEVAQLDLRDHRDIVACTDFHTPGRNDLLFDTPDGMVAETWDGRELWRCADRLRHLVFSAEPVEGRRILYALTGTRGISRESPTRSVQGLPMDSGIEDELVTLDGATGRISGRIGLPPAPDGYPFRHFDLSCETGRISGTRATDILVRTDSGEGGLLLWAFDRNLNPLWESRVHPGYGHHNAVHFFDSGSADRDMILAGGHLLASTGEVIWRHDRADSFLTTLGGKHYDAAAIGHYADDAECDPVVFLIGGSAGVYVVDGRTGRTRAQHRIGHAQWCLPCKLRDDLPGTEVMVGTRWGSYGILTLFSGRGDRLWSIQPDYILQGTVPIQWTPEGPQVIWCNRSLMAMGLYDGYGRLVKPLDKIRKLYGNGTKKPTQVLRRTPDGPDLLGLQIADTLHLFKAE